MGRSVSVPSNTIWAFYLADPTEGAFDEETGEYDYVLEDMYWNDFVDELRIAMKSLFPSLDTADEWVGREDRAILENGLVRIGISKYGSIVSFWCIPREDQQEPLAERWGQSIQDKVLEALHDMFGNEVYYKHGTFSNGEGVYGRYRT